MENFQVKNDAMVEAYGGRQRNITYRVAKLTRTTQEVVSFLNPQFVTREIDNFVGDQRNILSIMSVIQRYFEGAEISTQYTGNCILVLITPEDDAPTIRYDFHIEQVTVEPFNMNGRRYK